MKKSLILVCLLALVAVAAQAQLSSNTMMKIITRNVSPGIDPHSFGAQPKTLYRMGEKYGRSEELPDSGMKLHLLVVVSEPNVWMINLWDKTGKLIVDPGPTYVFRASIIPSEERGMKPPLGDFEFGTEYDFLRSNKAVQTRTIVQGKKYDCLRVTREGYDITLLSHIGTKTPYRVRVKRGERIVCEYEYDAYQKGLSPKIKLFKPPSDVKIIETVKP